MKQKITILSMILIICLAGCAQQQIVNDGNEEGKVNVATTFYPLFDLTREVAKDSAEVSSIIPIRSEPHSFVPSPKDIIKLNNADVYVSLGAEFEEFESELIESLDSNIPLIETSEGIELLEMEEGHSHDHDHEEEHESEHAEEHEEEHEHEEDEAHDHDHEEHEEESEEHHHDHDGVDPHIWLSPKNAMKMVENIAEGLVSVDPKNELAYRENAQEIQNRLSALDLEFKEGLKSCEKDTILVAHNAYSYLAKDYGFTTIAIAGLSPENEPTPKQIATLVEEAEEHDLKHIFYEEFVDPKVSRTIAEEIGAETLVLYPVAGISGEDVGYISLMQENLNNLKIALSCA